jgi:hypothetical protein
MSGGTKVPGVSMIVVFTNRPVLLHIRLLQIDYLRRYNMVYVTGQGRLNIQVVREAGIMLKSQVKRVFSFNGCNTGLPCPVKPIFCQEGWCSNCQVRLVENPDNPGITLQLSPVPVRNEPVTAAGKINSQDSGLTC